MKLLFWLSRGWYEVRWWRWFLGGPRWPHRVLYGGPWHLDKESRRMIIDRIEDAKKATEPQWYGSYPNRKQGSPNAR